MEAVDYNPGDFCRYLNRFKVEKGSKHTHTSIVKPSGAFYIPVEEEERFFETYKKAMKRGDDLHLTEKHKDFAPILVDLDFRFEITDDNIARKITEECIERVATIYTHAMRKYISQGYTMYVMQKPHPVVDKGFIKDGLHIVIPDIVTRPALQFMIRNDVMNELGTLFTEIDVKNAIEDIVDEAVIERNNWQMYGSTKPNCLPYKVTFQYGVEEGSEVVTKDEVDIGNHFDLVEVLSIRNKYVTTILTPEVTDAMKKFEEAQPKSKKKKMDGPAFQTNQNLKKNVVENVDFIRKIVNLLSSSRADSYQEWIRVGWCLRNIDYRLLDSWIVFSKKSEKFTEGECERHWSYMRDDGLGIGTLYMWARQDNPTGFQELNDTDLANLIYRSTSESHTDIAKVIHFMFQYDFVCCSIKQNYWYEFRDHKWVSNDCGFGLRSKLSNEVVRAYSLAAAGYNNRAAEEGVEAEQHRYLDLAKKLNGIALKLKNTPFKDNIMKECRELFYAEKFEDKLDSKCHLLGFLNGVYDLQAFEFRDGRPDDYISLSCGINFVESNPQHKCHIDIRNFISQIFPKQTLREYVLLLLSSFLNGNIREERFHIWTGTGANGKSKLIDLFEHAFGEYCCKLPITLLTQKRAASNAATSEIAKTKGKRFASLQEPSEDEKLNIGLMKELTGGDKIMARALFKDPIEFKPQFKMILTCNHLPNVPSDDGGTWRRLRVVEFASKFMENPNPENENEFLIDMDVASHFNDWKEHFMALLIEYHHRYVTQGIVEPEDVLRCTKEYQKNNDIMLEFVESEFERHETGFVTIGDAMAMFKVWVRENVPAFKPGKKKDIVAGICKTMGKYVSFNKVEGWKGWRIKLGYIEEGVDHLDC